jgi:N utilization substance protein B
MASNRHLGRIIALQTLYEEEFRREANDVDFDVDTVLKRNIRRYESLVDDTEFITKLVDGVLRRREELDITLQPIAPEWPIEQIARMDRIVLRMGLYELESEKDVPPKVVINEAIELAKAFGSENSSKFVNGVLGTALRNITGETEVKKAEKPVAKKTAAKKSVSPKKTTVKKSTTKPSKADTK